MNRRPGFAELFSALPVAVLVIGRDDRIAHANALAEQMLNLSERVMTGQPLVAILPPPEGVEARDGYGFAVYDTEIATARGCGYASISSRRRSPIMTAGAW